MIRSMFLGLATLALGCGAAGAASAQAKLAVAADVAPAVQSVDGATQGWTDCVASYIRRHSAEVQDPDDAADTAFTACRLQRVALRQGDAPRPVYARDDGSDQTGRYALIAAEARPAVDAR